MGLRILRTIRKWLWEDRLQYDIFCIELDVKPYSIMISQSSRGVSKVEGGNRGHHQSEDWPATALPEMKFLVCVTGHLGWKFSDNMLVLCQKHMTDNFFRWLAPLRRPLDLTALPRVEVLEPPLQSATELSRNMHGSVFNILDVLIAFCGSAPFRRPHMHRALWHRHAERSA